jgi:alkanesulfonate monooxygenase SsuD/methylene tetrahydromethanopterin reductase-like flavin-dependent oxidoreductase (luciferase family)
LDCGFGRAFLPHEFQRFERTMDESRARFEEGVEAVRRLLEEENVTFNGAFHCFSNVTSLPRPTQRPRPPFWVAALGTTKSLQAAGEKGYNLMLVPFGGPQMREAIGTYQEAWRQAGHSGNGKIALGFHMFCHEDREEAHRIAKPNINAYFESLVSAAERDSGWGAGTSSRDYPGYDSHLDKLRAANFDSLLDSGAIWVGTPEDIRQQISSYAQEVGGFDTASLQVNFHLVSAREAAASMRLFAKEVISSF